MIERIHLSILHEIDREGSLTAAANALCLTQSALSHSIRKLESQLGTPLWTKDGRGLRLTQSGQYLLGVARRVLPQLNVAQEQLQQYARGERGTLRIGMECHPCYRWLLKIVAPYLTTWPDVDVDVKQKFQFGGIGALFAYEIDLLVTPDPLHKPGLMFEPVFDYEQVLVVASTHPLANRDYVEPGELLSQTLITYPVTPERLDVFTRFLTPACVSPRQHKTIENTDIMLQMVASQRGVAALPRWLADEFASKLDITSVRLGQSGISKQIHLGARQEDMQTPYLQAFVELARQHQI